MHLSRQDEQQVNFYPLSDNDPNATLWLIHLLAVNLAKENISMVEE